MLKGIYSAAAGMTNQMIQADIVADNLANVNTPGYKPSTVQFKSFQESLVNRLTGQEKQKVGNYSKNSEIGASIINFTPGDMIQTGNPLDLALKGDGFFTLTSKENGQTLYTRAGNFTRDNQGFLSTGDGSHLQGIDGDIKIPSNAKDIKVSNQGVVSVDNIRVGQLKLAQFDDNNMLQKVGSSTYTTTAKPKTSNTDLGLEQGFTERSSSNVITEVVNSMTGLRTYESLQKSIQMQNETLGEAVQQVGRPA